MLIETERLRLYPATREQMEAAIASTEDEGLKAAYTEMLDGCLAHPAHWAWYAMWNIEQKDGTQVGDLCFKGIAADGAVEIGYGILDAYQHRGYASEAVRAAIDWAARQPGVRVIEAESESDNAASLRVLEKCGFVPSGAMGEEGPRFVLKQD